jgi:hypothetical protein
VSVAAGTVFFVGVGPIDIAPASRDLDDAVKNYREAGWAWEAKDVVPGPMVKPEDNAGPLLKQALDLFDDIGYSKRASPFTKLAAGGDYADIESELTHHALAMDAVTKAVTKPRVDFHRNWDLGQNLPFLEYQPLKLLARALGWRARVRASKGDFEGAVSDLTAATRLASLVGQEPTIIALLVDMDMGSSTIRAYEHCAALAKGDSVALRKLLTALDNPAPIGDFAFYLRGEAHSSLVFLRNIDRYGGAFAAARQLKGEGGSQPQQAFERSRVRTTGLPNGMLERACLDHNLRYWGALKPELSKMPHDQDAIVAKMEATEKHLLQPATMSGMLDEVLLPLFSQSAVQKTKLEASVIATKALLAAMDIQAKTGAFPKRITDIPGKWFDPFTGQAMKLKTDGKSIRIYSVGSDRKDDGGVASSERLGDSPNYDIVAAYPPVPEIRSK